MNNAELRRMEAVNKLLEDVMEIPWVKLREGITRKDIAAKIEDLRKLGRTERWGTAIDAWKSVVLSNHDLSHAVTQWAIFTNMQAY